MKFFLVKFLFSFLLSYFSFFSLCFGQKYSLRSLAYNYLAKNGDYQSSLKKQKSAYYEKRQVQKAYFPQVFSQGSYKKQKMFSSFGESSFLTGVKSPLMDFFSQNQYNVSLGLRQNIYLGGGMYASYKMSAFQEKMQSLRLSLERKKHLRDLFERLSLFESVLSLNKVFNSSLAFQKEFLKLVSQRRKKGLAQKFEWHQAQADYFSFLYQKQNIQEKKKQLSFWFKSYLDLDDFSGVYKWPSRLSLIKGSYEEFSLNREDLKIFSFEQKMIRQKRNLDRAKHLPQIYLQGFLGYRNPYLKDLFQKEPFYQASINFDLPLFSGGAWLDLNSKYSFLIEASKDQYEFRKKTVILEMKQAKEAFLSAQKKWKYSKSWSYHLKRSFNDIYKKYKQGRVSFLEVIQVQKQFHLAQLKAIEERQKYWMSWLQMQLALGKPIDKEVFGL